MKSKMVLIILLLSVLCSALMVWAGGSQEKQAEEARQEIAAVWDKYCDAVEQNDAQAFIALHEMEAYKMPPQQPMFLIGDAAPNMQAAWDKEAEKVEQKMSIDWKEIIIEGDIAWSMGTYEIISVPKTGGESSTFNGKFLTILRKQEDGSWKIYRDCFNSNGAM